MDGLETILDRFWLDGDVISNGFQTLDELDTVFDVT